MVLPGAPCLLVSSRDVSLGPPIVSSLLLVLSYLLAAVAAIARLFPIPILLRLSLSVKLLESFEVDPGARMLGPINGRLLVLGGMPRWLGGLVDYLFIVVSGSLVCEPCLDMKDNLCFCTKCGVLFPRGVILADAVWLLNLLISFDSRLLMNETELAPVYV